MPIKAVIFDLDGTITEPFLDFDVIRQQMGLDKDAGPILEAMQQMTAGQRQQAERILYAHERRAVRGSRLNPGAKRILEKLQGAGVKIGILTRNTRANAMAIARKHGLVFDAVVDRRDGPVKPDGFGVRLLCEHFGVKPEEAIVVGDYLFDLLAARAAGTAGVLLKTQKTAENFYRYADFIVDTLDELLDIIQDRNQPEAGAVQ
jgi:HAD superfamily hydrolase (TIGR01509 family)